MDWHRYFSCNQASGDLVWKSRPESDFLLHRSFVSWNKKHAGKVAGWKMWYHGPDRKWPHTRMVKIDRKAYVVHRIVWEMVNEKCIPDGMFIDHINGDPFDNRPSNLRLATPAQNSRNRRSHNRTTNLKGAYLQKSSGRFTSCITVNRKQIHIGIYDTAQEAHEAYKKASVLFHGEFARS